MRIGINILYLIPGHVGGTETYARELISTLARQINKEDTLLLYCSRETAPTFPVSKNAQVVTLPFSSHNRYLRILLEQALLPIRCITDRLDVLVSLGYSAPILHPCPSLVTIHDLNWYYHPEDFGLVARRMWNTLTRLSATFSNHIITDSKASKASLMSVLHVPESKVTTILHGTPSLVKPKNMVKGRYILTVVAGYPHKNLRILIQAFAKISAKFPDIQLKVCGLGGKADQVNKRLIAEYKLGSRVEILGYVSREELAGLYKNASVFVFPSAYEGFGYPVLEAMSYGAPVISSNAFSLREVVGNTGLLVDPYDVDGFAEAIMVVLSSGTKRKKLIEKGYKRVAELQWELTGGKTLQTIHRTVGER